MIVGYRQLGEYRRKVAMVDGAFDPLHHGHVEYFQRARAHAGALLCNIAPDSYTRAKHPPLLPAAQRAAVIDALRPIDHTHVSAVGTAEVLRELQPTHYIKGKDWEGRLPPGPGGDLRGAGNGDRLPGCRPRVLDRAPRSIPCRVGRRAPRSRRFRGARLRTARHRRGALRFRLLRERLARRCCGLHARVAAPHRGPPPRGHQGRLPPHARARRRLRARAPCCTSCRRWASSPTASTSAPSARELAPPGVRDRIRTAAVTDPSFPATRTTS